MGNWFAVGNCYLSRDTKLKTQEHPFPNALFTFAGTRMDHVIALLNLLRTPEDDSESTESATETHPKRKIRTEKQNLWAFIRSRIWSKMFRQQKAVLGLARRTPSKVNAWILGSSIASLASAVHLISDANMPASQIHILESQDTPGDGITSTGDSQIGYDHRPGCLPSFTYVCMKKFLHKRLWKDIEKFYDDEACKNVPVTHTLAKEIKYQGKWTLGTST